MTELTVVIATFNRGSRIAPTVEHLLASRLEGIGEVEIIVVDDGSTVPVSEHLRNIRSSPPFSLRVVRQANAGPAAARNAGFVQARGSLVLFMDDDILSHPDLLSRHVEMHGRLPRSVVFGPCPFAEEPDSPLRRFVNGLNTYSSGEPFTQVGVVASGQLSVERAQFAGQKAVYRTDLRVPGAEEFELSFRLRTLGVPIIMFTSVLATHDQPVELGPIRRRQYKYGVGISEVVVKCPELTDMQEIATILAANQPPGLSGPVGEVIRTLAKAALRNTLLNRLAELTLTMVERLAPTSRVLRAGYRSLLGASLYAGVQEGRRQFGAPRCGVAGRPGDLPSDKRSTNEGREQTGSVS